MKHALSRLLLSAMLLFIGAFSVRAETVQLRVVETADIHVHVMDYDYFQDRPTVTAGLVRTATLIEDVRSEVENSVLVDNGDLLQGNPLGDFIARRRGLADGQVHPVYKAMNLLDYAVANVGNHEFNYGLPFLEESTNDANFPYISANVFHDDGDNDPTNDRPYFDQYLIVDDVLRGADGTEHAIRIGYIGFVPPQILQWDLSHLKGRVVAHDIVDTARRLVPRMREEGADIVIAIPHSGIGRLERHGMEENATYHLSTVPGIDALMFGHSHRVFPSDAYGNMPGVDVEKGTINGVPATMPGFWGSHVGYVDLELAVSADGVWRVVDGRGSVRSIFERRDGQDRPLVERHAGVDAAVLDDHEAAVDYVRTAVGELRAPIASYFALVQDDPSVQIVTDAQKQYVERLILGTEYEGTPVLSASAPFKTGGRSGDSFTAIPRGEIALKHIADLYIYPNTVRAVLMSGGEVREWLEMSAGLFNEIDPRRSEPQELINPRFPSFNFDVIDGVSYSIDLSQPARYDRDGALLNPDSRRIVDLRYAGEPIRTDQTFIVATNNYRAGGGGGFPGMTGANIVIEAPDTNRDVLAAYILERESIDPTADGNWRFASLKGNPDVRFTSSVRGAAALAPESAIQFLETNDEGLGRYRIRLD
ncbi:MAG: bifunctional 2',3'-cyclic-nucleotide 2'-phosphodiesterase/3'-nucleotidase [Pseudomonadota bacterium]